MHAHRCQGARAQQPPPVHPGLPGELGDGDQHAFRPCARACMPHPMQLHATIAPRTLSLSMHVQASQMNWKGGLAQGFALFESGGFTPRPALGTPPPCPRLHARTRIHCRTQESDAVGKAGLQSSTHGGLVVAWCCCHLAFPFRRRRNTPSSGVRHASPGPPCAKEPWRALSLCPLSLKVPVGSCILPTSLAHTLAAPHPLPRRRRRHHGDAYDGTRAV